MTNAVDSTPNQTGGVAKSFRVVKRVSETVIVTGTGQALQKYAIAANTILMYDAFFDPGDVGKYFAGQNIIMNREVDIPAGTEVILKSE